MVTEFPVFERDGGVESAFFRIPFLLLTDSGTLIAGSDANRGTTGDSADNIDVVIRRKPHARRHPAQSGWGAPFVPPALDLDDFSPKPGYQQASSSVIDGAIVQAARGRIILLVDLFAWNGGVFEFSHINCHLQSEGGRIREIVPGHGFTMVEGRWMWLLASSNVKGSADGALDNINLNIDRTKFDHVADVWGPKDAAGRSIIYALDGVPEGYGEKFRPVDDSHLRRGACSGFTLGADFELFEDGEQVTTLQKGEGSAGCIPMRVYYEDSPLQPYNTSYILQVVSDDDGVTWAAEQIISPQVAPENTAHFILGPGAGMRVSQGRYSGRLMVPVYYREVGASKNYCAVIYSDDSGSTWNLGGAIVAEQSLTEACVVEAPGGAVQIFARNTGASGGRVVSAWSTTGGETWGNVHSALGDTDPGVNCQVSALTFEAGGETYCALATATHVTRDHGVIFVGRWERSSDGQMKVRWLAEETVTRDKFAYSSMAHLGEGRIGILYETSPTPLWSDGLRAMFYQEVVVAPGA